MQTLSHPTFINQEDRHESAVAARPSLFADMKNKAMINRRYILLNIKNMPCRRIIAFLCAFLLFAMLLAPVVHADSAVITSGTMYSYFQTYNTSGT